MLIGLLEAKDVEDLIYYELDEPSSDVYFFIGSDLKEREIIKLIEVLKSKIVVFSWTSYEILGIDP